jgi:hypothetical protein
VKTGKRNIILWTGCEQFKAGERAKFEGKRKKKKESYPRNRLRRPIGLRCCGSPKDSLPQSQEPCNCPYREPAQSSRTTHLHLNYPRTTYLRLGSPSGLFPSGFPTNRLTNSMVLVRERTIPTERPPLVGQIPYGRNLCSTNRLCGLFFSPFVLLTPPISSSLT